MKLLADMEKNIVYFIINIIFVIYKKQMKMSDKTLRKALDQKTIYNNYFFRELGEKVFI